MMYFWPEPTCVVRGKLNNEICCLLFPLLIPRLSGLHIKTIPERMNHIRMPSLVNWLSGAHCSKNVVWWYHKGGTSPWEILSPLMNTFFICFTYWMLFYFLLSVLFTYWDSSSTSPAHIPASKPQISAHIAASLRPQRSQPPVSALTAAFLSALYRRPQRTLSPSLEHVTADLSARCRRL